MPVGHLLWIMMASTNLSAVEPSFTGRKLYDSDATDKEFGRNFFPEGSQRVYVRGSIYAHLLLLTLYTRDF